MCESVVEIVRTTDGTPTQKLIAVLIAAGITDNKELAALTGKTVRAIQHARATSFAQPVSPEAQPISPSETHCAENATSFAQPIASSRARIETPSGLDSYQEVKIVTPLAPQGGRTTAQKRGSRLDPDWELPAEWLEWSRTNFPAVTVDQILDQAAQFRDFWIAKPGAQACKLDWEATWRNWCRRGLVLGHIRQPQHTGSYRPLATTSDDIKAAFAAAGV